MPVGYEIFRQINRPDASIIERFREIPTADLVDVMYKRGAVDSAIRPVYLPIPKIVGPAITVSAPDAAFEMVKIGLEMSQPGDVVMINARGNIDHALLGGNVCRGLKARGLAALMADGAIRDVSEIREDGFPVFSRGVALKMGPIVGAGEINVPIAFGGIVINPGDIIVADEDGIVAVPPHAAEAVLEAAHRLHEGHMAVQPVLLRGEITRIAQIMERAAGNGATIHDGGYLPGAANGSRH